MKIRIYCLGLFAVLGMACGKGTSDAAKGFTVTVTGESAATEGFAFPEGEISFRDGWEIKFKHVLVTIDKVTLAQNPQLSATDPSLIGATVASLQGGPFAVDLAKAGPLEAKEMNGRAWRLGSIPKQNLKGDAPFSSTESYAFGYELTEASTQAKSVNLDAESDALYQKMIAQGFSVLFQGTAFWRGDSSAPACRNTDSQYDWQRVPQKLNFSFGFKVPTSYVNCVNPELMPDGTRGVQAQTNDDTVAQITLHLDHPFWSSLEEDAPLVFDAMAARKSVASGKPPEQVELTEADLVGVDFQAIKDAQGNALPIRFCGEPATNEATVGNVSYEPRGVPVNPAGGEKGLKDLYDFAAYNLATFGHLNNDGLCYPQRKYPAP